ncbi:unnamed protein product [marine sediment metagenome]|uniref:Ribbon-helix-helix protein CopG domain-containing protein n=1 Tax=marine sediment metagenome TaxID=412755 RepID=X0S287_9ZZZZ
MAKRIYVSDWAYKRISELSKDLDMPMHMIGDEAIHLFIQRKRSEA